jgi:ACS family hexuronate transporter-like MFS transporter
MSETSMNAPAIAAWKWHLVWLMFLATMINYMDRQAILQTEKQITEQFQLSNQEFGRIEKYFGVTFAFTQIFAGFLADRMSIRWLYAAALLVWSLAGFCTGLVHTVTALLICRVILGFGESFNWPCAVGVIRRIMPRESQSLANGIFHGGASIGGIVTPLIALLVMNYFGWNWRWVFFIIGGGGALWAIAWWQMTAGGRAKEIDTPPAEATSASSSKELLRTYFHLFADRRMWLVVLIGVGINITWHLPRFWLTKYLRLDLALSPTAIQWFTAGYFIAADCGSILAGWSTRRLVRGGFSVVAARKLVMLGTGAACLMSFPAVWATTPWIKMVALFVLGAGAMGGFANYFALSQDVSPSHTAMVLGTTGFVSWYTVAQLQEVSGSFVDVSQTYGPILLWASIGAGIAALIGLAWPADQKQKPPSPT